MCGQILSYLFSPPSYVGYHIPPLLALAFSLALKIDGTARRLAHRPVNGSNTICNDPDPPLADVRPTKGRKPKSKNNPSSSLPSLLAGVLVAVSPAFAWPCQFIGTSVL
ncbi:hypothetical protein SDJN02_18643, partial [Cucurbita argyrosperma subsp. argyrosperma]